MNFDGKQRIGALKEIELILYLLNQRHIHIYMICWISICGNILQKERVKSIYYHEIIHWLRLMPYKIEKMEKGYCCFMPECLW